MPNKISGTSEPLIPKDPSQGKENKVPSQSEQNTQKAVQGPLKAIGNQSQAAKPSRPPPSAGNSHNLYLPLPDENGKKHGGTSPGPQAAPTKHDNAQAEVKAAIKKDSLTEKLLDNEHKT